MLSGRSIKKMSTKTTMKYWSWFVLATLLCQEFSRFRAAAAKKERKKAKDPNQYTEPFNTTLSNSEELHGHSKVGVKTDLREHPSRSIGFPSSLQSGGAEC